MKVIILKLTNICNLDCPYCYNRFEPKTTLTPELAEEVAKKLGYYAGEIVFHGGEPTAVGKEKFAKFSEIFRTYNPRGVISTQTNMTMYDDEWDDIFKKYGIRPGTSFDGLINDSTRANTDKFIRNVNKAKNEHNRNIGSILIYNKNNIHKLIEEYEYLKSLKLRSKFNPVFEVYKADINELTFSSQDYSEGLIKLMDYWIHDVATEDNQPFDIEIVREYLNALLNNRRNICHHKENCIGDWLSIKPNGDIFPCGRDWKDDFKYANIQEIDDIEDIYKQPNFIKFKEGFVNLREQCRGCLFENICNGGCPAEHLVNGEYFDKLNPVVCHNFREVASYLYEVIKNIDLTDPSILEKYNHIFIEQLINNNMLTLDEIKEVYNNEL